MRKMLKTSLVPVFFSFCCFMILGCRSQNEKYEDEKFLNGTNIRVVLYGKKEEMKKAAELAFKEMERVDREFNNHTEGGVFDRINKNAGKGKEKLNKEQEEILKRVLKASEESEGKFDITISPVFDLWGFESGEDKLPNDEKIKEALNLVNYKDIVIDKGECKLLKIGEKIETGSFLKGYAIYRARKVLEANGVKSGMITAISSIETIGKKPNGEVWKIGAQNPQKPDTIMGILKVEGKSIGVSGDYQTYIEVKGKRYHHILNAHTGYPFEEVKMVVIVTDNGLDADIYSTAIFLTGVDRGLEIARNHKNIDVLIVDKDMKTYMTEGMKKYFEKR